jgi:TatA/E family protein of Tat protein translocase
MIGVLQPWHLIVVLVIVVMMFGPGKLPELGRAVGDGLRELKRSSSEQAAAPATTGCRSCNSTVPDGARFCGICGTQAA